MHTNLLVHAAGASVCMNYFYALPLDNTNGRAYQQVYARA